MALYVLCVDIGKFIVEDLSHIRVDIYLKE